MLRTDKKKKEIVYNQQWANNNSQLCVVASYKVPPGTFRLPMKNFDILQRACLLKSLKLLLHNKRNLQKSRQSN